MLKMSVTDFWLLLYIYQISECISCSLLKRLTFACRWGNNSWIHHWCHQLVYMTKLLIAEANRWDGLGLCWRWSLISLGFIKTYCRRCLLLIHAITNENRNKLTLWKQLIWEYNSIISYEITSLGFADWFTITITCV